MEREPMQPVGENEAAEAPSLLPKDSAGGLMVSCNDESNAGFANGCALLAAAYNNRSRLTQTGGTQHWSFLQRSKEPVDFWMCAAEPAGVLRALVREKQSGAASALEGRSHPLVWTEDVPSLCRPSCSPSVLG